MSLSKSRLPEPEGAGHHHALDRADREGFVNSTWLRALPSAQMWFTCSTWTDRVAVPRAADEKCAR